MKTGAELIAEERKRQIEVEDWTPEHMEMMNGQMAVAGACYALGTAEIISNEDNAWKEQYGISATGFWPWDDEWYKPTPQDPIRQLTKAGALIAAEIDRLQRYLRLQEKWHV